MWSLSNLHGCLFVDVNAAAASGSPALSAPGFGFTHDPSAPGLDSAHPARRHLQLRPPVSVQHPRVSRTPGQGGQEFPWRGRRPPWWRCRQIRLAFIETLWFCHEFCKEGRSTERERKTTSLSHWFGSDSFSLYYSESLFCNSVWFIYF